MYKTKIKHIENFVKNKKGSMIPSLGFPYMCLDLSKEAGNIFSRNWEEWFVHLVKYDHLYDHGADQNKDVFFNLYMFLRDFSND